MLVGMSAMKHSTIVSFLLCMCTDSSNVVVNTTFSPFVIMNTLASNVTTDVMAEARDWKSSVLLELTCENSSSSVRKLCVLSDTCK